MVVMIINPPTDFFGHGYLRLLKASNFQVLPE